MFQTTNQSSPWHLRSSQATWRRTGLQVLHGLAGAAHAGESQRPKENIGKHILKWEKVRLVHAYHKKMFEQSVALWDLVRLLRFLRQHGRKNQEGLFWCPVWYHLLSGKLR